MTNSRLMQRVTPVYCSTLVALICAAANGQGPPGGPPPALVRMGKVQRQQVSKHRLLIGQLRAVRRSLVACEEAGRVIQAPPDPGTAVKAGAVLVKLDDTLLRIQRDMVTNEIEEAEAMVAERVAEVDLAARHRAQLAHLTKRGATTLNEVEDATDQQTAANARLRQAKAIVHHRTTQAEAFRERLTNMQVLSPFEGTVVRKSTEVGQWLSQGQAVAELLETTVVDAVLDVPEYMVRHVAIGRKVDVLVNALGLNREGVVHRVVPDADTSARTFPVMIRLQSREGLLKPGMTVSVNLPTGGTTQALTVPRDAVWATPGGSQVFVNRGGRAAAVPVTVRFGTADRFVVEGAMRDGEEVVVEGNERLMPGQRLKVMVRREAAAARGGDAP